MNKKVSIIIPFYNCAYVEEAVESALNQTYPHIEVIVVDDGSTQHVEKLEKYIDTGRIKYCKKENGGTASALNQGIRAADGEYFCWLSSDDVFLPDKVLRQVEFMEQTGSMASFMSFYFINENSQVISEAMAYPFTNKLLFYKMLRVNCPINGCTVMLDSRVFDEIGYFDESLPYTHDYDFWLRLIQVYDFLYIPLALLYYRVHGEMGTKKHAITIKLEIEKVKNKHSAAMKSLIKQEIAAIVNKNSN
ncbi:glycosyltransferase [Mesobacillus subterraneus]|uniref:Glycosyltransferase 2-like domain-containing protein n=1 Tax=Mesobacillus subterraneus TaxID=285983 RepID=A0A0D6ZDD3_9BACI|nr:glycosyltransferase [Mesobacillus subterraneus]KIY23557.1 hypothetical protein UB32_02665 [Mesobacillus subterraneus]